MAPVKKCFMQLARRMLLRSCERGVIGLAPPPSCRSSAAASRQVAGAAPVCCTCSSFLPQRPSRLCQHSSSSSYIARLLPSLTASAAAGIGLGLAVLYSQPAAATPAEPLPSSCCASQLPAGTEGAGVVAAKGPVAGVAMAGPAVTNGGKVLGKLRIFIGYDPREDEAYDVCRHSILKHSTLPVEVVPIRQSELRAAGLYTRMRDATESTEFSFTRFLTPFLAGFESWAMFVDCDFLYTGDVRELVEMADERFALMCVHHDYTPRSATKMDGVPQTCYPRKNWSSMVLYNCAHPKNRILTPGVVNSQTGAFLHRFLWLDDADIGALPFTWNFLVGHHAAPPAGAPLPRAIHFTSGGPWFEAWRDCDFAPLWLQEREELRQAERTHKRITELEGRLQEVAALQRLLFFCLHDKVLPARQGGEAAGSSIVAAGKKQEQLVEPAGLTAVFGD